MLRSPDTPEFLIFEIGLGMVWGSSGDGLGKSGDGLGKSGEALGRSEGWSGDGLGKLWGSFGDALGKLGRSFGEVSLSYICKLPINRPSGRVCYSYKPEQDLECSSLLTLGPEPQ